MPARRFQSLARSTNLVILAAIYLALCFRAGRFSPSYWIAVGVGGCVLLLATAAAFGRNPLASLVRRTPFSRPLVRTCCGTAPWLLLFGTSLFMGLWLTQRPWALRLLVVYVSAVWSIVWLTAGSHPIEVRGDATTAVGETKRRSRDALLILALPVLIGADGIVWGLMPFGVSASALLAFAGSLMAFLAVAVGRVGRSNLLAVCFGLVIGLVSVECGIRFLHLGENLREVDSREYVRQFYTITPPRTAFVNWPKTLDEFQPALVEINSMGIRGPEIAPGPVDLLLIGDSMIEARQLPWEQTLGPQLQAALKARSSSARVVSHGMRGWSPLLEWNWYLKVGRRLHARTVLLFFFWNDLWSSGDEVQTFQAVLSPTGRPDYFDVPVDPAWVWYKHVRTVRVAAEMVQRVSLTAIKRAFSMVGSKTAPGQDLASARALARRMAGDSLLSDDDLQALLTRPANTLDPKLQQMAAAQLWGGLRPLEVWTGVQRRAAAATEIELQRFAEDVRSDGGRLVIVYVPNAYQVAATECSVARYLDGLQDGRLLPADSGVQAWLRTITARHGIELVDPSEAMRERDRVPGAAASPLYLRADCHWSEHGHSFMAGYLADWYLGQQGGERKKP